jgi:hypothetical protein
LSRSALTPAISGYAAILDQHALGLPDVVIIEVSWAFLLASTSLLLVLALINMSEESMSQISKWRSGWPQNCMSRSPIYTNLTMTLLNSFV